VRGNHIDVAERWTGREFDVDIGAPVHGGSCIARHEGRVLFVRHALPGERVRVQVTEDGGGSFCRADAVAVLDASADRVGPPCPHAGPGRCGGCDWQHASAAAQLKIKADVVREQFRRIADVEVGLTDVEALPGGLVGWRTRIAFAVDSTGTVGLHRHRSNEVEPVRHCPLGVREIADARPAPAGVTGVVLLEESHACIHTWPELGCVTLDVYVCSFSKDNKSAARALFGRLVAAFAPEHAHMQELERGVAAQAIG